ncbi:MAG: allantoinase AllB [Ferruginibacter sp.]
MNTSQKIYSSRCWIENKLQPATIVYEEGLITGIHFSKLSGATDAGDHIIMPGIIDAHVHINEPGRTDWEGFDTATQAAAAGAVTTIIDMPLNASPVTTTLKAFNEKINATKNKLNVNVGFYGGLIPGNTKHLEALIDAGVLGIKCFLTHSGIDEFPNVTEKDLDEAMPVIAKHHIPLLVHCELFENEIETGLENDPVNYKKYLASRPKQWENDAIALMIKLCRKYKCAVHIVHVSSAEALEQIKNAKAEGLPLTAETCPQYIYFNAENIPDGNCLYKCAPPIREKENNEQLKKALADGILDFISTDHSPAPPAIKEIISGNFKKAWGGIAGLQFLLPASWTALKENISLEKFIPLLTEHPAQFLKIDDRKGFLKVGYDADFTAWNPDEKHIINAEEILFRHKISPYIGEDMFGTIEYAIVNGSTVYENKKQELKNAGRIVLAKK